MNNFNNPNGKYVGTPNFNGGTVPYSYGNYSNANLAYPNGYSPYNQNNGFNQPQQQTVKTNHIYVTSLEDALARSVEPNSEIVYLHQDKPLLYNVRTDMMGKKTYTVLELKPPVAENITETKTEIQSEVPTIDTSMFVSKKEFEDFKATVQPLIDRINKSKEKAVEKNG